MAATLLFAALAPLSAQEAHLNGLGWVKSSPGSVVDGQTRITVHSNEARAPVSASGGKASVGANLIGRLQLIATAQANSAGLGAADARSSELSVLNNQLTGFVDAVGGAATANVALFSGGDARRRLEASGIAVVDNRAGRVRAIGGEGDILLGAVGSLQLPGRASANSVLLSETDARKLQAMVTGNRADEVTSVGGAALANALTMGRSNVQDSSVVLTDNRAQRVSASGGTAHLGAGLLASADLTGAALANSVAIAGSQQRGMKVLSSNNEVSQVDARGGSAHANSVNVEDSNQVRIELSQSRNRASQVAAYGGRGSLLAGGLAEVDKSAIALVNSVSLVSPLAGSEHAHVQLDNQADRVQAQGGGAAANSIWVQRAAMRGSAVTMRDNRASDIATTGGAGSLGAGVVGAFERNSRALANSVVLDQGADMRGSSTLLSGNEARNVRGYGGVGAANSALVGADARVSGSSLTVQNNQAQKVSATGFNGSVGAGLIGSVSQQSLALANSLGVFGSEVTSGVTVDNNRAHTLVSNGGTAQANSVSIERGEGSASRLAAVVAITSNDARNVSSGARSSSGPAHAFSSSMEARAAANALVLKDGAKMDGSAPLEIARNQASNLEAVGGTVLVNALAAYRGATVAAPVTLRNNIAQSVSAGGGSSQAAGVGTNSNGVVVVNGLYLDGGDGSAVSLRGTPLTFSNNTGRDIRARGGRINANALAINGQGSVSGGSFMALGNTATGVSSSGSEGTVLGHAAINRGVGHANANALQALGAVTGSSVALIGNQAADVRADKGLTAANSVVVDKDGSVAGSSVNVVGNEARGADVGGGKTTLANSVLAEGSVDISSLTTGVNQATVRGEGAANSVALERGGSIRGSNVVVLGNRASVQGGGTANSVRGRGSVTGSQITILGNQAQVNGGGLVNSVDNRGRIDSAQILIAANTGAALGGGTVNSVENHGQLSGRVTIIGNRGTAVGGGTVNSVVNHGVLTGTVTIAGNTGSAGAGGTANSLINRGVVTGNVSIVGNASAAGAGMTAGSVRVLGVALVGTAGVAAGVPAVANPGYNVTLPATGVVSRSVTVLPGVNVSNM